MVLEKDLLLEPVEIIVHINSIINIFTVLL